MARADCSFIIANAGALLLRIALKAQLANDATSRTTSGVLFTRLVVSLTSSHHAAQWDVASLALDRIATLLHSLNGELPELVPLLQPFDPPNHANPPLPPPQVVTPTPTATQSQPIAASPHSALSYLSPTVTANTIAASGAGPPASAQPVPVVTGSASAEQPTSPLGQSDPFWWMQTEILPLPEHLEDLSDAFEEWGHVSMGGGGEAFGGHRTQLDLGGVVGQGGVHVEPGFDLLRFLQGRAPHAPA